MSSEPTAFSDEWTFPLSASRKIAVSENPSTVAARETEKYITFAPHISQKAA
ncbi:MAG TPA: hypothetical protein VEV84_09840 [Pyrinomonadaceae bacterium]|nr:hypothetical protein [Pyrinomonadaceae bacterium]